MATVEAILTAAARQCSLAAPDSWVGMLDDGQMGLRDDFLPQVIDDLQERFDLSGPFGKTLTITGDGSEANALPEDFLRLKRGEFSIYESTTTRRRCYPINTDGEWEYMKELGSAGAYRFYRLRGYGGAFELDFYRPLETGSTAIVNYMSNVWIINDGTEKSEFTAGADVCMFPKRLIVAGVVFRWRESEALPFGDKYAEYEALATRFANDSRSVRMLDMGGLQQRDPWDIPVPDVIPSA